MNENTDDGKIRVVCTHCGKRVKFPPGKGGEVYACPACGATIVAPLGPGKVAPAAPVEMRARPVVAAKSEHWQAARLAIERNPYIEKLINFLGREELRVGQECQEQIIAQPPNPDVTELARKFVPIRREHAFKVRQFVQVMVDEINEAIGTLQNHPMKHTARIQEEVQAAMRQKREFGAFVSVIIKGETPEEAKPGPA
jgi:hypothetical protein